MRKILFALLICLVATVFAGCSTWGEDTYLGTSSAKYVKTLVYLEETGNPALPEGVAASSDVMVRNLKPGSEETLTFAIANGEDRDRIVSLYFRSPGEDETREGFEPLPEEYLNWFHLPAPEIKIEKGYTCLFPITISVPRDADCRGRSMELRLVVKDTTQTGLVRIVLEPVWFVITLD